MVLFFIQENWDTMENKRVYGIDLGTTYSAISYVNDNGEPEIITNSDNERTTPSVVFFDEPYENGPPHVVVGRAAKASGETSPERTFAFIKQQMGTDWTCEIDGIKLTPEKVSAYILRRLVVDAKRCWDLDVEDVVITCPAYFDAVRRQATIDAGKIAGLNVLQLLDEPVAAAMHYGLNKEVGEAKTAIVYDLGGGTFDVSVVSISDGVTVICSDGDHQLGGKDWDQRIVEYCASRLAEACDTQMDTVLSDSETSYDLQIKAEVMKQALTQRDVAIAKIAYEGTSEKIELTREAFDEMTRDLLERTAVFTQKMIDFAASEKGITRINDFLLVGGSTRMPQVMEMIKEKFASQVDNEPRMLEVDEAVAKGAAIAGLIENTRIYYEITI